MHSNVASAAEAQVFRTHPQCFRQLSISVRSISASYLDAVPTVFLHSPRISRRVVASDMRLNNEEHSGKIFNQEKLDGERGCFAAINVQLLCRLLWRLYQVILESSQSSWH